MMGPEERMLLELQLSPIAHSGVHCASFKPATTKIVSQATDRGNMASHCGPVPCNKSPRVPRHTAEVRYESPTVRKATLNPTFRANMRKAECVDASIDDDEDVRRRRRVDTQMHAHARAQGKVTLQTATPLASEC